MNPCLNYLCNTSLNRNDITQIIIINKFIHLKKAKRVYFNSILFLKYVYLMIFFFMLYINKVIFWSMHSNLFLWHNGAGLTLEAL